MEAILNALHAPRRREILRHVWDQELCAGDLCRAFPDITAGAVSQHLRVLLEAGLVSCRAARQQRFYLANKKNLGPLRPWLESMWDSALYRLKIRAELEEARRGPRSRNIRRKRT